MAIIAPIYSVARGSAFRNPASLRSSRMLGRSAPKASISS